MGMIGRSLSLVTFQYFFFIFFFAKVLAKSILPGPPLSYANEGKRSSKIVDSFLGKKDAPSPAKTYIFIS